MAADIPVDSVEDILNVVNLRLGQVLGDALPQGLGQGREVIVQLLAFLGQVNAEFAAVPGVGLAEDETLLLQGVQHPGDVGLVFGGLFPDLPLGEALFLPEMANDGPLLRGDLETVLFETALQGGLQGQGRAVDHEAQGILDMRVLVAHKLSYTHNQ